ncbi:wax ester synthase/diacylglycerol acyltransferase 4-like [Telopea speciosissima]|uniref:wax ester synthase/diacylglycerol acyltransferase 4-like n=1 Tax=Telopea speciosissima TaxID=54955 RepID=UPI001CC820A3|nr:wax ester synthase/diacylglycerol acyltransferase 4-like [Telopea speciosissima]
MVFQVRDEHGVKQWKRVDVKVEDHVHVPIFPDGLSPESYEEYLQEYLAKIAMEKLPQSRPLWEIHLIKYPTSNAAGTVVFKLHHALGDGFSLMGALFNCLRRADNPSLPLTFPSSKQGLISSDSNNRRSSIFKRVTDILSMFINTTSDFAWSILKSSFVEDDWTPIRAGNEGVEFRPITISTVTFSLDQIKQIKDKLGGTINDVITGIIFYGTRLYMQNLGPPGSSNSHSTALVLLNTRIINSRSIVGTINDVITGIIFYGTRLYMQNLGPPGSSNSHSTALVLLNTRIINNYQMSLKEMMNKPDSKSPWGNQFIFLHVSIPDSADAEMTTAQYVHSTLKNTSMAITNMIGPMEQMSLADHPIRGLYFMVVGAPQSLAVTIVSYMGKLRVAVGAEKGFINEKLYISCLENAFTRIFRAAVCSP